MVASEMAWGTLAQVVPERGRTKGRVPYRVQEDVEWACEAHKLGMGAATGKQFGREEEVTSLQVEGS
jgi:hypothetical protein